MTVLDLLNPFTSALALETGAESAAAPDLSDPPVAAADQFESRFMLDERAFMDAIVSMPAFLLTPRPEYLANTSL